MKINRTSLRTIEIMKLISDNADGLTLEDICSALQMPKTSCYDILVTLVQTGMVDMGREDKIKYYIGLGSYRVGVMYSRRMNSMHIVNRELQELAVRLNRTVMFGVPFEDEVTSVYKFEPENPAITAVRVGSRRPMYCTSLGKAMLSAMSMTELHGYLDHVELQPKTPWTIVDKDALLEDLRMAKERGYSVDNRELESHMLCVGAPVFDMHGKVVGAVSASGLYGDDYDYHLIGEAIAAKAAAISQLNGYVKR